MSPKKLVYSSLWRTEIVNAYALKEELETREMFLLFYIQKSFLVESCFCEVIMYKPSFRNVLHEKEWYRHGHRSE